MNAPALPRHKVLMTVDAVGGVWRFAMELARPLRRLGVATVFAGFGPQPTQAQRRDAEALGDLVWLPLPLEWMAKGPEELAAVPAAIEQLAQERGCTLLHLNLPSQAAGISPALPVVAMSHSCLPTWWRTMRRDGLPEGLRWQHEANARGFDRADAIVAPSHSHAGALEDCYGRLPSLEIIHNAFAGFIPGGEREAFAFAAGRWWDEGKNGALIDAAAALSPWPVRVAGESGHPAGGCVRFAHAETLGPLPHDDVIGNVRRAGLFVSASLYEPFGLSALEAARAGAPLLLSDIPVYRELWRGAARLFDPHDPASLGGAIRELAADPAQRAALGALALARSRRFTPDRQARAFLEIYARLLPSIAVPQEASA